MSDHDHVNPPPPPSATELADLWDFPWPVFDVLIGGQSAIDLPELSVETMAEASDFLRTYGYDADDPRHARHLHAVLVEAISLIERRLLSAREWSRGIRPPDEIIDCDDPRQLMVWASDGDPHRQWFRVWACAVLRVMHTIGHIQGLYRALDIAAAREQIFDRFRRHLWRDEARRLWFGEGAEKVELALVEWKESKSRDSIIMKLLHKRDNVAESIYDYLGVRIVTRRLCDVMLVVKILNSKGVISFPNAYPSRSRNSLIDVARFRAQIEAMRDMLSAGTLASGDFDAMLTRLSMRAARESVHENPHSATSYRSIQLTGRQLVRLRHHDFEWLDKIRQELGQGRPGEPAGAGTLDEVLRFVEGWHTVNTDMDVEAYFPFELQIMDQEAHAEILDGDAAHERYKQSQIRAARKRVLSQILEMGRAGGHPR